MDRRMLLAMLLAVLVLVANSLLFGSRRRTTPPPVQVDSTQVTPSVTPLEPPIPGFTEKPAAGVVLLKDKGAAPETTGTIRIETDLIRAEFDPLGGTVRSWALLRYTDAASQQADLVRSRDAGAPWFAVRDGARVIRTDSTRFRSSVVRDESGTLIRFVAEDTSGLRVEKAYLIRTGRYDCELKITVAGVGEDQDGGYWEIGWEDGLPTLERDPRSDQIAISAVALFGKEYVRNRGGRSFGCAGGGGGERSELHEGTLRWFGVRNRYFLGAVLLEEPRQREIMTHYDGLRHTAGVLMKEPLSMSGLTEQSYRLYLGPILYTTLERYGIGLERVQDLGPGILRPFSKLLMKFFEGLNHVVPNYGFEILILSILIRLIFYPLTKKSMDSMKRMQQLKPQMDRINEQYKDKPEQKNREILELYRKNKINPLSGCIPVLVQLPVLSGLYYVLANAVQLRKEPFVLWIRDLSAPDTVAHVSGFPINVLPLIMAATMLWQQKMTPTDPRQAGVGYIMPIMMTFFFYSTPSGLVFYWTVSNLMTALQQMWMNRAATEAPAPAPGETSLGGRRRGPGRR